MHWLAGAHNPGGPGPCPAESALSVRCWNVMGGLDWAALPVVAEMFGIRDIDALIADLVTIRDAQRGNDDG